MPYRTSTTRNKTLLETFKRRKERRRLRDVKTPGLPFPVKAYSNNHRCVDCPHDPRCMGKAAMRDWPGFSCQECDLKIDIRPVPEATELD